MCIPRRSRPRNMQLRQRSCRWCFRAKRTQRHRRLYRVALQREDHRRELSGAKMDTKEGTRPCPFGSSMVWPKLTQVLEKEWRGGRASKTRAPPGKGSGLTNKNNSPTAQTTKV